MSAPGDRKAGGLRTSIVICCYTSARWDILCRAIAAAGDLGADEFVVVVDHNPDLRGRLADAFPALHVADNTGARGLSDARNSGIAATTGDIVVFLDDDAVAEPALVDVFRAVLESDERVLGAVASIRPGWPGDPPRWFPDEFLWVVGCTYAGLQPGPVRNLIGAAMAIRRSVFGQVGGFSAGLGRGEGALPLGCEETELCIRARRARPDGLFLFEPLGVCRHHVTPDRATWRYLVRRCFAEGLSKAQLTTLARSADALATERHYVRSVLPRAVGAGLGRALRGEGSGALRAAAIGLGLATTVAGYALGRARIVWGAPASGLPAARAAE